MSLAVGVQSPRNYWWLILVRSIVTVLFGIAALVWPGLTLIFFIYLFGIFAIVEGIIAVAASIQERQFYKNWWVMLLSGITGIIVGILVFLLPGIASLALFYLVAGWALATGILAIASAFSRYTHPGIDWPLILGGVALIILGLIMAAHPVRSILSIVWVLGLAALIYGVLLFVRSFQFKSQQDRSSHETGMRSGFQAYSYPDQSMRSNIAGTDSTPQGRNPSVQGTMPTSMPPGRNPSIPGDMPATMPPGRNPSIQGDMPTSMPPGRNPSTQGDIPPEGTFYRREETFMDDTPPARGDTPPKGTGTTRGNVPPRGTPAPGNRPPTKGNIPPKGNVPPENTRRSDTFATDEEENS